MPPFDGNDPRLKGYSPSNLPTDQAFLMKTQTDEDVMMCGTVFPSTPSGKIELFDQALEDQFGFGTPRFAPAKKDLPFTVISPSSKKRTNATFGGDPASTSAEVVEINPIDACVKGIENDMMVTLTNALGSVSLKAVVTDATRPGVLYTPKGTWLQTSSTGQTVNALISADMKTDIVEGACYNETFVELSIA